MPYIGVLVYQYIDCEYSGVLIHEYTNTLIISVPNHGQRDHRLGHQFFLALGLGING